MLKRILPVTALTMLSLTGSFAVFSESALAAENTSDFCKLDASIPARDYSEILNYADQLGWVKKEDLPEHLKDKASPRCDGFYIESGQKITHDSQAPISIEADNVRGSSQAETSRFDGNVVITQQKSQSFSNMACYDKKANQASLFGDVLVSHSGVRMLGDSAEVDLTENNGQINNALFSVADAHLRGQSHQMNFNFMGETQQVDIDEGDLTFCEPSSNAWKITAQDIELDFAEGWGEASHIKLKIHDVPVFYFPWMNFPLDDRRKTGFLYPSVEVKSGENAISTPFYWNIAPNYDATITPRFFENRGEMLEAEFRYLNQWGMNRISGGYLGDDDDYPEEDIRQTQGVPAGEDRWSLHFDHLGKVNDWKTEVDFNRVSDDDYRSDFGGLLSRSADGTVDQIARASWSGDNLAINTQFRSYQITDEEEVDADQYKLMPDLAISGLWTDFDGWRPSLFIQTSYFDRIGSDDDLNSFEASRTVSSALRGVSELTLDYDLRKSWAYLTPGVTLYNGQYQLSGYDDRVFDSSASYTLPSAHITGGLFLERPTSLFGQSFTQTLEPQIMYAYIPYQDQSDIPVFDSKDADLSFNQLFKPNRFTGGDRVGDTSQISMGVTTRFVDDQGSQTLVARAGTILYLKDRKVDLTNNHDQVKTNTDNDYDMSNYVGEVRYSPLKQWSYQFDFEWSDRLNQTERSSHGLLYRLDQDHVATLRYNEKKDDRLTREEFLEFSAGWQVTPFWTLFHRWEYDLSLDRTSDILNGVEYNNCCWRASVVYRNYYTGDREIVERNGTTSLRDEFDSGIFFMFELKGLAGTGSSTEDLLQELIEGINQRTIYDY
ncbi:LPS-assembly protein LptD [Litoribrevibacter albus]|uniref:LPS-assembly protein LptD n=1 Tax=Litoribrevibacter albus TaxID=1473156 RepID=A0AA37SF34_9GAMM|nr:LPS assembly protein LptD [Litoribrevibacter albus]GLQ33392.1 LPS-assembly protein LptD [Litoribrevibacter albus]